MSVDSEWIIEAEPLASTSTSTELATLQDRETAIDSDGWIYDLATGEVLGHAEMAERFTIDTDDAADWALQLKSKLEGDVAGIDIRLQALKEILLAVRREKVRRLSWWQWRFAPDLIEFARRKLAGTRSRTANFTWGKVQFRATQGTNEILDDAAAVAWMKVWDPSRVKVSERVTIKDVLETIDVEAAATGEQPERPNWLKSTGPQESVTISTGIDVKLKLTHK